MGWWDGPVGRDACHQAASLHDLKLICETYKVERESQLLLADL